MGLDPFTIAAIAVLGAGTAYSVDQQQQAAREQRKVRKEQVAVQAAQRAQERRQQIREERIRRARILQASENRGVAESSGEAGSVGSLQTQLQSNIGFNLGMQRSADLISNFQQNAQDAMDRAAMGQQLGQLGASIFNNRSLFSSTPNTPQLPPVTEAQPRMLP